MPEAALKKTNYIEERDEFRDDVVAGLKCDDKRLHPKYFYDKRGSDYFDQICDLDEYYPYKVELALLPEVARDLAALLTGRYALIEFGAGSLLKVKPLLESIIGIRRFVPIDISGDHLRDACAELAREFTELDVVPVEGDFTQPLDIGEHSGLEKIGFFPGSTIGNLNREEAVRFLQNAGHTLGADSYMLIGVDTKKSPKTLHLAYNDTQGVTAKFNLNILDRINEHFDAPMDKEKFEHYAYYNVPKGRVEMHLVSLEKHSVVLDDEVIGFEKGESIHTESSYKYSPNEFQALAGEAGWQTDKLWLAKSEMFSVFLLHNRRG